MFVSPFGNAKVVSGGKHPSSESKDCPVGNCVDTTGLGVGKKETRDGEALVLKVGIGCPQPDKINKIAIVSRKFLIICLIIG